MDGECSSFVGEKSRIQALGGQPEGKRANGRPRRRWEDNIKMDIQEMRCGGMDWFELLQYKDSCWALVNEVINLRIL
jgi:hypothetical protein